MRFVRINLKSSTSRISRVDWRRYVTAICFYSLFHVSNRQVPTTIHASTKILAKMEVRVYLLRIMISNSYAVAPKALPDKDAKM